MIKVGVVGSEGFTVGELIGLLINHPDVILEKVYAPEYEGILVSKLHPGLFNVREVTFTSNDDFSELEVLFVCLSSTKAKEFYRQQVLPEDLKIIDFSFELRPIVIDGENKSSVYLNRNFVYGLPEMNRREICNALSVSVPGSFANSIILSLLPLAKSLMLTSDIHVSSIIGRTESAARPSSTDLNYDVFSDRLKLYQPFEHRQLDEVKFGLQSCQHSFSKEISLLTMRGYFVRGTYTYSYFDTDVSIEEIKRVYKEYFDDHSFIHIVDDIPDLRQVVNTNYSLIYLKKHQKKILAVNVQDNLLKGSAGTAVHIMNLMCGLVETTGLILKSLSY